MSRLLTKSKYLLGLQCPKLLWVTFNAPDRIPAVDEGTQKRFDEGHEVGRLARTIFPNGIEVTWDNFGDGLRRSTEAARLRKTLLEPGFCFGRCYARADILYPTNDGWDIIEVKSSTSVKDINIHDVAFQKYCFEGAGMRIRKCFVLYVNNQYIRKGEIDAKEFFVKEDVTDAVNAAMVGISGRVKHLFDMIAGTEPAMQLGEQCDDPYSCGLKDECWKSIPEHSVFSLYSENKRCFELYRKGIIRIADIPDSFELSDKQKVQKAAVVSGKEQVDAAAIRKFLDELEYPLHFLDFESFATAIPKFDGLRPYQQVPFQYSLHVQETKGGIAVHRSFLADGNGDPRRALLDSLKKDLQKKGSIVAYNASFEKRVLNDLALLYPKESRWVKSQLSRFRISLVPFRNFSYYNPVQDGSASLKQVLPALTGITYEGLEIGDGGEASQRFLDMAFGGISSEEASKIREALEKYCGQDTEGMLLILNELEGLAGKDEKKAIKIATAKTKDAKGAEVKKVAGKSGAKTGRKKAASKNDQQGRKSKEASAP